MIRVKEHRFHIIGKPSDTQQASPPFCYIGVGNTGDGKTVRLDKPTEAPSASP